MILVIYFLLACVCVWGGEGLVVVLGSLFEVGPRGPCCEVRRGQALPRVMTSDRSTLRWLPRLLLPFASPS